MIICRHCCKIYDNETIPIICCGPNVQHPIVVCNPDEVTRKMVACVEQICGMGSGAWDTIDPAKIIAAAITVGNMESEFDTTRGSG
jgi:hypothetical protein